MHTTVYAALAGHPNSGKSTLFNALTGSRQHTGNYPGVTVERREGWRREGGRTLRLVDLPGTYSLTAYSLEERIARDVLLGERPDVVVDVIDASGLERNLYLATQLMETGVPLVLALNMSDLAEARGRSIDYPTLSALLGVPVVPTVGHRGLGVGELVEEVFRTADEPGRAAPPAIPYGEDIERELGAIVDALAAAGHGGAPAAPLRWTAVKLLEHDGEVRARVAAAAPGAAAAADGARDRLRVLFGDEPEAVMADRRFGFVAGACHEATRQTPASRQTASDRIDAVLTHPVLGLPLFLAMMYLVFQFVFRLGNPAMNAMDALFSAAASGLRWAWPGGWPQAPLSLLTDGILGGVGGVVVFLPNILLLFLAIAALEDSGYMARAAYVMDHLMHRVGLHGKSFIPMLLGFGCSVPAVLATRTLENRRDRLTTMLVIPLISCGARLTIYALFIPAFFPLRWQAAVLLAMYLAGIVLAIAGARVLRLTLLRGETVPLVMELPPYRLPTWRGLLMHSWRHGGMYLRKAGTIILGISIVLWALTSYPRPRAYARDYAAAAAAVDSAFAAARDGAARGAARPGETPAAALARVEAKAAEVAAVREAFRRRVARRGASEGSVPYLLFRHDRDAQLEALAGEDAGLYAAAVRYLDDVRAPRDRQRADLAAGQQSERLAFSLAGRIGRAMAPVLRPLGFDWRIGTALLGAFAAKEVFVAQMGVVFAVGEGAGHTEALRTRLREHYTALTGLCVMIFCLVAMPCAATVAVVRQESGSWKWALFQALALTALAYVLTLLVHQGGRLLGFA